MNRNNLKSSITDLIKKKCEQDLAEIRKLNGEPQPVGYSLQDIIDLLGDFSSSEVENTVFELVNENVLAVQGRDYIYAEYDRRGLLYELIR